MPKPKARSGEKKPESKGSDAIFTDNDRHQDPLTDFQSECMGDGTVPGSILEEIFQYSSIGLEESNIEDPISQPLDDVTLADHLEPSSFDATILEDVEYPELDPDKLETLVSSFPIFLLESCSLFRNARWSINISLILEFLLWFEMVGLSFGLCRILSVCF